MILIKTTNRMFHKQGALFLFLLVCLIRYILKRPFTAEHFVVELKIRSTFRLKERSKIIHKQTSCLQAVLFFVVRQNKIRSLPADMQIVTTAVLLKHKSTTSNVTVDTGNKSALIWSVRVNMLVAESRLVGLER